MRTTLDISEDVLLAVKERAKRTRSTAGEVLSDLARQALNQNRSGRQAAQPISFHGFEPLPSRGTAVSNELIDRLREDDAV